MTDYDTAILAALPQAYWKLNEASGVVLHDSSPNGFDLTGAGAFIENYAIPGPGPNIPAAADFGIGGTHPSAASNTVGNFAVGQPFSVEGWVAGVGPMGAIRGTIVEKGFFAAESRPWWVLALDTTGEAIFWLRNAAGTDFVLRATGALNDATYPQHGPFHHLVGTYDPTAALAKLYVDAVPAAQLAVPNTGWGTGAQHLAVGEFANDPTGVWLAAIAVYTSLLTPAGVLDHFQTGLQGTAFYTSQLAGQLTDCQATLEAILAAVRRTFA